MTRPGVIQKRIDAVSRTLVGRADRRDILSSRIARQPQSGNRDPDPREHADSLPQRHLILQHSLKSLPRQPPQPPREDREAAHKFDDRIRLPDVATDLRRIDEILERDVVQTTVELGEEQRLDDREQRSKAEHEQQAELDEPAAGPGLDPAIAAPSEMPQQQLRPQQGDQQIKSQSDLQDIQEIHGSKLSPIGEPKQQPDPRQQKAKQIDQREGREDLKPLQPPEGPEK
ncbi:MAG: hypothetical protein FD138_869 [Planctomycetota bacterium]|nr:MAG: hypothetical protein FD138_869 [Planctomycetota bacterium]